MIKYAGTLTYGTYYAMIGENMRSYCHRRSLHRKGVSFYHWFIAGTPAVIQERTVPVLFQVDPVPLNLNLNPMRLVPSWSAIGWIVATGATILCGAILWQCAQNQALLDVIK